MEQRKSPSFTSGCYQGIVDFSTSHETYRSNPHGSVTPEHHQGRLEQRPAFHGLIHDFSGTTAARGSEEIFDPWLLEVPHCGSPLSENSTISTPESVSTPPCTGQPHPLYHLLDQPVQHALGCLPSNIGWAEDAESNWQRQYVEADVWTAQPSLPPWSGNEYTGLPLPPMELSLRPVNDDATASFSLPTRGHRLPAVDSAPFKLAATPSVKDESSEESDSDSETSASEENDPSYGQAGSSRSASGSKHKASRTTSPVLKLGKWANIDPFNQPEPRHYICAFSNKPDPTGRICHQRFVRPEHLRRHVTTVHGNERKYKCKVPQCQRAFSRGDNLREHYSSHLIRGARQGRNDKMTLTQLTAILGPKEKKLVRRLKRKMLERRCKL